MHRSLLLAMIWGCLSRSAASLETDGALLPIPDKLVVLTFDDGNKSDRAFVADVLTDHGFGATFYITEGLGFLKSKQHYVTWDEVRELHELGFEIGNHTRRHRDATRLSASELLASIAHIDARCAEHAIPQPTTFCFPGFRHSAGALAAIEQRNFLFARRGVGPEFPDGGEGARGPHYDPQLDHPLLIPTTGYAGPEWSLADLQWAVEHARDGKIAVLCFHGVPAMEHPWVTTSPDDFRRYMQYLADEDCTVIAMRDLARYVDPARRPQDAYERIERRRRRPRNLTATPQGNGLGLPLDGCVLGWSPPPAAGTQNAFRILVATQRRRLDADVGDLWDSGWRYAAESRCEYLGAPLPPDAEVWWKVQIRTADGAESIFSAPASIATSSARRQGPRQFAVALGGEVEFRQGRLGGAVDLSGAGAAIQIPDYPELRPTSETTLAAWIQPTETPDDWRTVFRKEDGDDRRLLAIGRTGDVWGLWVGLGIGGRYVEFGAAAPKDRLGDGSWRHVAASYDGAELRLYVDGVLIGRQAASGAIGRGGEAPAFLGSYAGAQERFVGGVDDVRVYERALSGDEIATLANGEDDVAAEFLVGRWKLDGDLANERRREGSSLRVVFLGDGLISGMERYGYLETALTARWPRRHLTFRNLGWPADDPFGTARSEFGSDFNTGSWRPPNEETGFGFATLTRQLAEAGGAVTFVGYGAETAFFETPAEQERFQRGYEQLLDHLSESGLQIVLLSPPKQEPRLPSDPQPTERNERLAATSRWIRDVALRRGLGFVDLFQSLQSRTPRERLTENGVHLNQTGYLRFAEATMRELGATAAPAAIDLTDAQSPRATGGAVGEATQTNRGVRFRLTLDRLPLFPGAASVVLAAQDSGELHVDGELQSLRPSTGGEEGGRSVHSRADAEGWERLRELVVRKNSFYRAELRPLNKTYVSLFRRHEMGHLSYEVDDLARLVAEHEALIAQARAPKERLYELVRTPDWEAPRDYPDHEVPQEIPDPSLGEELASLTAPDDVDVALFAADPMIANPINLNWDGRGRAWVASSTTYPHLKPGDRPNDRIVILEDVDQDGTADRSTVFADGLLVPHSVIPVPGGAYVCSTTELLFLADHDGDDRADERRVVFSGFGNADVHHMIHGLRWSPWGDLFFTQSIYINSFIETPHGRRRLNGSGIWRFRPETEALDVFARGMVNPWGHAFDDWGQSFATDGAGGAGPHYVYPGAAFQSAVGADRILPGLIPGKPKNAGAEFLSGRRIPQRWAGKLASNDFRANRTVLYELREEGSGYAAEEVETILHSSHRSFRPVDLKMGPDGALYVVDWYNPIIDHGEVDFYHPSRDRRHGRIWRLAARDAQHAATPQIAGASLSALAAMLDAPEQWTRIQANRELARRDRRSVLAALQAWVDQAADDASADRRNLQVLWLSAALGNPSPQALAAGLASKDHRARAAAVRMVGRWSGVVEDALDLLARAVADEHPRVRLEAVHALRAVGTVESVETAMRALDAPVDGDLDYALWLTARATRDRWLPELQAGRALFQGRVDRLAFALQAANDPRATEHLLGLLRSGQVNPERRQLAARVVAAVGASAELGDLLTIVRSEPSMLSAVVEGARSNEAVPTDAEAVSQLLEHADEATRTAAAELAGKWRVNSARTRLREVLVDEGSPLELRLIAGRSLASMGDVEALAEVSRTGADAVRTAALTAMAAENPDAAAADAAAFLASDVESEFADQVFAAFLSHSDGAAALIDALSDQELPPQAAAAGVRVARAAGRDYEQLVGVLTRQGGLSPLVGDLSPDELRALVVDAAQQGDVERGREVYGREELACAKCHGLGDGEPRVGPSLATVASYMTGESLADSLFQPSRSIKQGYETVIVVRTNGTVVAGTLQRRTDSATLLRNAEGELIAIPSHEIDAIESSPVSLMPQGLTANLRRDELLDLLRFLMTLGKPSTGDVD